MSKKNRQENAEEQEKEVLSRKEKIAYEKELVREGKILPRYSPRNPLGRLVILILVFFIGLFAAIGGIIGTFAYLGTRPVKEGFKLFNLEYDKFLTEDAASKSVLDLTQTLAEYQKLDSLGAISSYTPLVDTLLDGLETQLGALGVHVDKDELKATPFHQIGTYFSENVVQTLVLGEALSLKPGDNALLITLCYGEEGVDYEIETVQTEEGEKQTFVMKDGHTPMTVGSIKGSDMSALLDKVTLEAAMNVTASSDAAIRYLAYGSEGVHYEIRTAEDGAKSVVMLTNPETNEPYKKKTIAALTAADADLLGGAKIGDLVNIEDDAQGILAAVKDWTIADMGKDEKLKSLKIGEIIDLSSATGIMKTIADKNWTIAELADGEKIKALTINEIIDVPQTGIMGAVGGWSINELSDTHRIERLKISQILDTENANDLGKKLADWRVGELTDGSKFDTLLLGDLITIDDQSPVILRNLADTPLGGCGEAMEQFRLSDILGEGVSENKLLGKLQNSTLKTLSADIEGFTVADLFGDELYAYMKITQDGEGNDLTYSAIVKAYETGHADPDDSKKDLNNLIVAKTAEERKNIFTYYKHGDTEVVFGVFEKTESGYTLLGNNLTVYTDGARKYVERVIVLTPVYEWKRVDYATGGLLALPAGDSISDDKADKTLATPEGVSGEPYLQDNKPLYYLRGDNYYPLFADAYSVYFVDENSARTDLDYSVSGYTTPDGEPLVWNSGKVTYCGKDYFVKTKKASGSQDAGDYVAGYNYITAQITVEEYYYDQTQTEFSAENLYTADTVKTYWHLKNDDGTFTELDRFLDEVWYLIFGGEERNADGSLVLDENGDIVAIDRTSTPLFEVAESITGVTDTLNKMPLWKLFLHGIISANPYAVLPGGGNLNELTITGCIQYITNPSSIGG